MGPIVLVMEFVLIPVFLIWQLGWPALVILPAFYFVVRPAVGAFRYSLLAAVVDNLFTAGVALLAFYRRHWIIGAILVAYLLWNIANTRIRGPERDEQLGDA